MAKIKKELRKECECYFVGNRIVCFLVGRFFYLGKPSDRHIGLPDDCRTIQQAREFAMQTCREYVKNGEFDKAVAHPRKYVFINC